MVTGSILPSLPARTGHLSGSDGLAVHGFRALDLKLKILVYATDYGLADVSHDVTTRSSTPSI
jgi:hypothetical protein